MSSRGYPSDWNARRKTVYERDNYKCQNCGEGGGSNDNTELHAHHIVPKSKGGTHNISNLKTLCEDCHNAIHGDSMAPSASTINKENSKSPLPLRQYKNPYVISEHLQHINKIGEISRVCENIADKVININSISTQNSSKNQLDSNNAKNGIEKNIDELDRLIQEFNKLPSRKITEEILENIDDFEDVIVEFVAKAQEYVQTTQHAESHTDSIPKQKVNDLREEVSSNYLQIKSSMKSNINDLNEDCEPLVREVDQVTSDIGKGIRTEPKSYFDKCPICGSGLVQLKFENSYLYASFYSMRCSDCMVEWVNTHDSNMEVVYGPEEIEETSLDIQAWEEFRRDGRSIGDNIDKYRNISDKCYNIRYKLSRATIIISAGLVIISLYLLLAGSILLSMLLSLIMLVSTITIFTNMKDISRHLCTYSDSVDEN